MEHRKHLGDCALGWKWRRLLAIAALGGVLASAYAQDGPQFGGPPQGGPGFGGPPPGGGPGFGGPGFGGPGGRMGAQTPTGLTSNDVLIQRQDVQDDLDLTKAEKSKIDALQSALSAKVDQARQDGDFDPQEFDRLRKNNGQELLKALTPAQAKRLHEIAIQLAGTRAILDSQVQKELGLSPEQVNHASSLVWLHGTANSSVSQKLRSGEIDAASAQGSVQYNARTLDSLLKLVLNSRQATLLQTLGGRRFAGATAAGSPDFSGFSGPGSRGGPGGPGGFGGPGGPGGNRGPGGNGGGFGGYGDPGGDDGFGGDWPGGGPPGGGPDGGPPGGGPGGPPPGGGPGGGDQ